jgi:lysophospholipase
VLAASLAFAALSCRTDPNYPKQPAISLAATDDDDAGVPGPNPKDFSDEETVKQRYDSEIGPFFESGTAGGFRGVEGVEVRYHAFRLPDERGAIVLLPARAEPVRKYAEVIRDLTNQGYSVFALDHRGQGESERLSPDGQVGYVEYFHDYVDDLETFIHTVVMPNTQSKPFLLGHGMGAGIAVLYLDEHKKEIEAVTLISPLIELNLELPNSLGWTWSAGDCSRSSGKSFAPGQSKFDPNLKFEGNDLTHSVDRFDLYQKMMVDHSELQLGGYSNRWLCEAVQATSLMQTIGIYARTPTLILWAEKDDLTDRAGMRKYCDDAAGCQRERFPKAFHDILNEQDESRNDALAKLVNFFRHVKAQ